MTRAFHLGDILSITTSCLVSPRHMDGIYDILNYMTGISLFSHELPKAADACRGPLLTQHPDLVAIVPPHDFGADPEAGVTVWLAAQVERYGETREVEPLAEYPRTDPFTTLREAAPRAHFITMVLT